MGHKWIDPTKLQGFVCGVISWSCFIFERQGIKQTLPISMNFIHPTIIDHFIIFNQHYCPLYYFIHQSFLWIWLYLKKGGKTPIHRLGLPWHCNGMDNPNTPGSHGDGLIRGFFWDFPWNKLPKQPLGHPRNLDFFWTPDGWNPWNPLESKRPSPCRRRVRRSANACCAWKPSWGLRRNCVASCIKKQPLVWCYGAKKAGHKMKVMGM